jgi:hypothetical protein
VRADVAAATKFPKQFVIIIKEEDIRLSRSSVLMRWSYFGRVCLPKHLLIKKKRKHKVSKYLRTVSCYFLVVMMKVIAS